MDTMHLSLDWLDYRPKISVDIMSLILALALHLPIFFMKMDMKRGQIAERLREHVISDVNIITEIPTPEVSPPPAVPVVKGPSFMDKLKMLVKKEPPPPPPPPKADVKPPEKLDLGPKPIELKPKLEMPDKLNPALQSKSGFKTAADAKLVQDAKINLSNPVAAIAPLSASKLGTIENRNAVKSKEGFKVAQNESLHSIDSGPGIAGGAAPTIAIRTGKASQEGFSAPPPQMANKGKMASAGIGKLGETPQLGLRDSIIARDASSSQIGIPTSKLPRAGGSADGVDGGTGIKKDAGRFASAAGSALGGSVSPVGGVSTAPKIAAPARPKEKKSMFLITGPLKDRKIERQILPEYPAWAQAQGIEAAVILEFTVLPDGNVKDSIVVRRTSGYPKLDQTAMQTLKSWKFAPIADDQNREEVGTITFNYSLQ